MLDAEELAEIVVLNIQAALAPVLARLDALDVQMKSAAEIRDRVVAIETKSALPVDGLQALRARVDAWAVPDVSPLQERLAAAEARLGVLGDLRDRVVTVEGKAAAPDAGVVDRVSSLERHVDAAVGPLQERLTGIETALSMLGALRDRLVVVETKAATPAPDLGLDGLFAKIASAETKAASTEASVVEVKARLGGLDALRERLVTIETKSATPDRGNDGLLARVVSAETKAVSAEASVGEMKSRLGGIDALLERVVTIETKAAMAPPNLGPEVRDRLVTLETKSSMPLAADAAVLELRSNLMSLEERVETVLQPEIAALRERAAVLEAKAPQAGPAGPSGKDGKDGRDGKDGESVAASPTDEVKDLRSRITQLEPLRERLAVVEVRGQVPGPAGKDGEPGKDGLGWDDLSVVQEDDRTFAFKCAKGMQIKDLGTFTVPVAIYRGVYREGQSYDRGDRVTWAGSEWHCSDTTSSKPGDGSKSWQLAVKRGRDGKDGKDGEPGRAGRDLTKDDSGRTW